MLHYDIVQYHTWFNSRRSQVSQHHVTTYAYHTNGSIQPMSTPDGYLPNENWAV